MFLGYCKVNLFISNSKKPNSQFSIIIPFRNEAKNIEALLDSISILDYPKDLFEIIFVNDDSKDESLEIIKSHFYSSNIKIINNQRVSNAPKKDAIQTAISHSKFKWIVTTDADCVVKTSWLQSLDSFIQNKKPKLIAAPVTYKVSNKLLDYFQLHDFLSLQTTTAGGFGINMPFMCNGANLCYSKAVFNEVNGFNGNNNIISGDDLFMLEKVVIKYPKDVYFLKTLQAVVYTKPESTINSLYNQRIRWASKTSFYSSFISRIVALVVLLMNTSLVLYLVLATMGYLKWDILYGIFLVKFSFDFLFILKSALFFNQTKTLIYFPVSSLIYPLFIFIISLSSIFFNYRWKGRSFKN